MKHVGGGPQRIGRTAEAPGPRSGDAWADERIESGSRRELPVMISSDTTLQNSDETRTLFAQTMALVAVTAGLFALGAYLGRELSYGWGWVD
jgi:hypothetical protein